LRGTKSKHGGGMPPNPVWLSDNLNLDTCSINPCCDLLTWLSLSPRTTLLTGARPNSARSSNTCCPRKRNIDIISLIWSSFRTHLLHRRLRQMENLARLKSYIRRGLSLNPECGRRPFLKCTSGTQVDPFYSYFNQCAQKSNYLIDSSINQEGLTNQSIKAPINCQSRGDDFFFVYGLARADMWAMLRPLSSIFAATWSQSRASSWPRNWPFLPLSTYDISVRVFFKQSFF
jgi:hypothetical protein